MEIRYCRAADGTRLAYGKLGSGPPLLKSAQWMTHLELDSKSLLWRHWLRELSLGRTLTCYDGRGCGLSDTAPRDISFEAMVQDFEAVAEAMGQARFPVLGFCHGGPIAIAYAARHPERVSALILCGTYAQGRSKRGLEGNVREDALLLQLIEAGWGADNPAYRQVFTTKAIPGASAQMLASYNEMQRASASGEMACRLAKVAWDIEVCDLAQQVRCPTLVMHATRDALVPFGQGQLLASLIADAQFVPLDSSNHDLLEDEPAWPCFIEAVRGFLAAHDAGAPEPPAFDALTPRERDVLSLVAKGFDNAAIAAELGLTEKTVRNYVSNVLSKLEVTSRARAIVIARESGLGVS